MHPEVEWKNLRVSKFFKYPRNYIKRRTCIESVMDGRGYGWGGRAEAAEIDTAPAAAGPGAATVVAAGVTADAAALTATDLIFAFALKYLHSNMLFQCEHKCKGQDWAAIWTQKKICKIT
jgi:hypothetical protein